MKLKTTTMLAVTSLGIGAAQAAIISVNLTDGGAGAGNADITELAGVVEAGGWEVAGSGGALNDTNLSALRADDNGTLVTTTATMTVGAGFGGYHNFGTAGFNTVTALFNDVMMNNFIETVPDTGGTIDFTNLNSSAGSTYDVYVYLDRKFSNTGGQSVTVGGITKFIEGQDHTGLFSEADYGTLAAAEAATASDPNTAGNYILFSGLTSDSLNLTFSGDDQRTGINGIQIVGVPEPSSTALLGLGGLALILRRRK